MSVENPLNDSALIRRNDRSGWLVDLLLILILLVGGYFRFVGINWDDLQHVHPDERFMTMVASSISPVKSIGEYFNTSTSTLNPNNVGHGFYVYGTLPLFLVRIAGEITQSTGYDQIHLIGRALSGFVDLLTVLLVYSIARRLYHKAGVGLVAAAFSAAAVLQIQLSHYWTVDTFTNFFTYCAFYFAVRILTGSPISGSFIDQDQPSRASINWYLTKYWKGAADYLLFGIFFGFAMASKVSAFPAVVLLPAAAVLWYSRQPANQKSHLALLLLRNLVLAGFVAVLVFRICQPYAFSGPGFFGIKLNPNWVSNLQELSVMSNGDVDFPPALQWARRPVTFALQNMVQWGVGLPLGLLAWAGFMVMAWRIFKGEWQRHILLWGWTGIYFVWQSLNFSSSMRYQLPVYPALAIMAAWLLGLCWEARKKLTERRNWIQIGAAALGGIVIIGTFVWAFAFTRIYTRPETRVAASEWILDNIPAAVNVEIKTETGKYTLPVPWAEGTAATAEAPLLMAFTAQQDGVLSRVDLSRLVNLSPDGAWQELSIAVYDQPTITQPLTYGVLAGNFQSYNQQDLFGIEIFFDFPYSLIKGNTYWLEIRPTQPGPGVGINGMLRAVITGSTGEYHQTLLYPVNTFQQGDLVEKNIVLPEAGRVERIYIHRIVDWEGLPQDKTIRVSVTPFNSTDVLAYGEVRGTFLENEPAQGYWVNLNQPVELSNDRTFAIKFELLESPGKIGLYGSAPANESTWDMGIPFRMNGMDPYGGIYRSDLNFELYWDDNPQKLARFVSILDQADYIFISSNRQWGTTTRVQERYPLTTAYYRNLIGCPAEKEVLWCYNTAQPDSFNGTLGFELVKVFESFPNIGPLRINDQFAEEAFTVYDHAKVLIFKKTADYDPIAIRNILGAVDLTNVVHITPGKTDTHSETLMLPDARLGVQRAGGTWSELFNTRALTNRYPAVAAIVWYLAIFLLGIVIYPFVRLALGGLPDKGYPLAKMAGILLLSYLSWLIGSANIPVTRLTIWIVAGFLLVVNIILAKVQWAALVSEWKERKSYFLRIELITLVFFLVSLLIRIGNPDLWHPYFGGEKPMDFSYLNAVIRSTTFPPYDPWFAGGYINYYYFGFVIVGMIVKWLGIVPAIGYNLFLPTLFSLFAMGLFSSAWNLMCVVGEKISQKPPFIGWEDRKNLPMIGGLAAAIGVLVLGNLGTVRMIWHGLMKLAAPGGVIEPSTFGQRFSWTFSGIAAFFNGMNLPYGPGQWYWIPSRAIPGDVITEFPFFTFLYGDPHAHLFALPLTALALAWAISILFGKWRWDWAGPMNRWLVIGSSLFLGAVTMGSLRPTNTWDMPTYLAIGFVVVMYSGLKYLQPAETWLPGVAGWVRKLSLIVLYEIVLVGLSFLLYQPYAAWYVQGYNAVDLWKGLRSPFWSYITHWGLFLFVIVSWLYWETYDWMAKTPLSSLNKLKKFRELILILVLGYLAAVIYLTLTKVEIGWVAVTIGVWAAALLFRPDQPDAKRMILFLVGTATALTIAVEVIVLVGDVGRMNTVFKFYLQAWTLYGLSAAAGLIWLLPSVWKVWTIQASRIWQTILVILLFSASLFPLYAGADKIRDRMSREAPHTLDGMAYMTTSTYWDNNKTMDLSQDYRAIRWMQENVKGSPVIVEANVPEYRWGSRYTIYTGLPGVVGWNWHQRQQRGVANDIVVWNRVNDIGNFYNTANREQAEKFLRQYQVKYIVVGQLERATYHEFGLAKFVYLNGDLWNEVYRDGETVIYEVN